MAYRFSLSVLAPSSVHPPCNLSDALPESREIAVPRRTYHFSNSSYFIKIKLRHEVLESYML